MKKFLNQSWLFPNCLFIFFSIYLLVKFVFIFFFKAAYEPQFIFQLTPLYLLSGFSNVQLISLSLLVIVLDMVLHLQSSKRNLLLSFLPTSLMLSSIAFTIMFNSMDISYFFHYLLFGLLVVVVLIDYQYVLKGVEAPTLFSKKEPVVMKRKEPTPSVPRATSLFAKKNTTLSETSQPFIPENLAEFKRISEIIVQKMQTVLDDLERKTVQIEKLEKHIEQQQHNLLHNEKLLSAQEFPSLTLQEKIPLNEKNHVNTISAEERLILKERIENHLIIDEKNDIVAIVQRGIFKEISNSFAGFLGYERHELLQKNFFIFIAPRGFEDARKYYLNRLKGVTSNSLRTVLLTKAHTELAVEITVIPTIYNGETAEFLNIKEVKN